MLIVSNKYDIMDYVRKELKDDVIYDCRLTKHRDKRSAEQNALAWAVITEIANELRANKFDVYFDMLKAYGQSFIIETDLDEATLSAYFKYYETLPGGQYIIYRGSSEYNSYEMSVFIDGILNEAAQMDIAIAPYQEVLTRER